MTDFKAKMHQIRFRLGLRPRPQTPLGQLTAPPDPLAGFGGPTSKEKEREGRGGRVGEGTGREGRGGEGKGGEGKGGDGKERA